MTKLSRAALKAKVDLVITDNNAEEITGPVLNDLLKDVSDSLASLDDDQEKFILMEHNPAVEYLEGQATIKDGDIYQANEDVTGAWNAAKWTKLTAEPVASSSTGILNYDDHASSYPGGGSVQAFNNFDIPSGLITTNGQFVRVRVFGDFAANTNSKRITVTWGNTVDTTFTTTQSGGSFWWETSAILLSETKMAVSSFGSHGVNSVQAFDVAATASGFQIRCKYQATSSADIVVKGVILEFIDKV